MWVWPHTGCALVYFPSQKYVDRATRFHTWWLRKNSTTSGINSRRFPNTTGCVLPCLLPLRVSLLPSGWGGERGRRMLQPWGDWEWSVFWKKQGDFPLFKSIWNLPRLEQVWDNPMSISWEIWRHTKESGHLTALLPLFLPPTPLSYFLAVFFPSVYPFPFLLIPSSPPFLSFFLPSPLIPCFVSSVLTWLLLCSSSRRIHPTKDHLAPVLSLHPIIPVLWGAPVQWPQGTLVSSPPSQCSSPVSGGGGGYIILHCLKVKASQRRFSPEGQGTSCTCSYTYTLYLSQVLTFPSVNISDQRRRLRVCIQDIYKMTYRGFFWDRKSLWDLGHKSLYGRKLRR